ncbi:MAG: 2-C-methyl-D-erythritol 2,4-cyclodiphosphate synthase [Spirochaetes bacterium GWF1_41_5]|nr:MAG: 2-C-methyl-D-erythritol 2,4-cyclodiphosphate synthase [Spirochaetes bacterium GWF1_41_5]HBE02480.1 2-C-methyl-D-erythritol 2,4-cyclodiphosphate synthase [Spirochaetia bacterium]
MYRTGIGHDTHRLVRGRRLILGGVDVPHVKGLLGHSDADALIHSVIDALLGAAGERDIGMIFPDTDQTLKNISSLRLLEKVYELIKNRFRIVNIDSVIICEKPKLKDYIPRMIENFKAILLCENIGIKASTTEKTNDEGREKCITCHSVCLLEKKQV